MREQQTYFLHFVSELGQKPRQYIQARCHGATGYLYGSLWVHEPRGPNHAMEEFAINQEGKEELANRPSLWDNRPAKGAGDVANKRDYQKERKAALARGEKMIGVKVTEQMASDFTAKCQSEGTTKNAVLYNYIEQYTYGAPQPKRKEIVTPAGTISLAAWAAKQGISRQRASILLKEGRIPCAIQKGRYWYVPEDFVLEK